MSNGFLPAWLEANEMCPGVCQSWVSTTCSKARSQAIDDRDDLVALVDGQRAARSEAVLHVDDEQDVLRTRLDLGLREGAASPRPARGRPRQARKTPGECSPWCPSLPGGSVPKKRRGGQPVCRIGTRAMSSAQRGVRVHAERIDHRAPQAVPGFDAVDDGHVVRVRDALEAMVFADDQVLRRDRLPCADGSQLAVDHAEILGETPVGQVVDGARHREILRSFHGGSGVRRSRPS